MDCRYEHGLEGQEAGREEQPPVGEVRVEGFAQTLQGERAVLKAETCLGKSVWTAFRKALAISCRFERLLLRTSVDSLKFQITRYSARLADQVASTPCTSLFFKPQPFQEK